MRFIGNLGYVFVAFERPIRKLLGLLFGIAPDFSDTFVKKEDDQSKTNRSLALTKDTTDKDIFSGTQSQSLKIGGIYGIDTSRRMEVIGREQLDILKKIADNTELAKKKAETDAKELRAKTFAYAAYM